MRGLKIDFLQHLARGRDADGVLLTPFHKDDRAQRHGLIFGNAAAAVKGRAAAERGAAAQPDDGLVVVEDMHAVAEGLQPQPRVGGLSDARIG